MGSYLFGYAIEMLRDEAPRSAASTPPDEAILAAGYDRDVGEFSRVWYVPRDSDCSDGLW
jgi:hypothetical protein